MLVIVLQFVVNILLSVLLQGLHPLKVASPFTPFDGNFGIACVVNNPDNIPISFSTVCHKSLEVWLWNSALGHDMVRFFQKTF